MIPPDRDPADRSQQSRASAQRPTRLEHKYPGAPGRATYKSATPTIRADVRPVLRARDVGEGRPHGDPFMARIWRGRSRSWRSGVVRIVGMHFRPRPSAFALVRGRIVHTAEVVSSSHASPTLCPLGSRRPSRGWTSGRTATSPCGWPRSRANSATPAPRSSPSTTSPNREKAETVQLVLDELSDALAA